MSSHVCRAAYFCNYRLNLKQHFPLYWTMWIALVNISFKASWIDILRLCLDQVNKTKLVLAIMVTLVYV